MAPRPGPAGPVLGGVALMNSPLVYRLAIAGLVAASLALAGCGRKGPLEAPGGAAVQQDDAGKPVSPKPDKHFILDPLVQ
jgi:predicted small lipoprotein YifL